MTSPLRLPAVRGAAWGLGGQAFQLALQFAGLIVLARLLDEREFGLAGMVFVVNGLAGVGADAGMSVVAVARRDADQRRAARLALAAGAGLAGLVAFGAPLLARAFDSPSGLVPLLRAGAPLLLLAGLVSTPRARLARALRFGTLARIDGAVALAAFLARTGFAWRGLGAWSLVLGDLLAAALGAALAWACAPPARGGADSALLGDGVRISGTRAADAAFVQADRLLVGRFLGAGALGLYGFALQHTLGLARRFGAVVEQVALPLFSRLQSDRAALARAYLAATRAVALAVLPACALLWWLAPDLIGWIYPARWLAAVPALRALCVAAACTALNAEPGVVWFALGRTRLRLVWSLLNLAALVPLVALGLRHGLPGVAYALAVRSLLAAVAAQIVTRRVAGVGHLGFLAALGPGVAAAGAVLGAALLAR